MSALTAFLRSDWRRTRARLNEAWSDRPVRCHHCAADLRCWRDEDHCPSCRRSARWNAGFWTDGRFNLALVMSVALSPMFVLWLGLSLQEIWLADKAHLIALGAVIDPEPLLTIDAVSFTIQLSITGLAMLMSLARVRKPMHALKRLAIVCVLSAAYWAAAPHAYLWL